MDNNSHNFLIKLTSRQGSYKSNCDSSDQKISDAGEAIEAVATEDC